MSLMARTGPAPLTDERRFVPETIDEARQLYAALVDDGSSLSMARGIVTWLIMLPERRADDPAPNSLRRDYRRQLQRLGLPPWDPDATKTRAHISVRSIEPFDHRRGRADRRRGRRWGGALNLALGAASA